MSNQTITADAASSTHLDVVSGTVNTAVLLISSLAMATAVHAAQTGRHRRWCLC